MNDNPNSFGSKLELIKASDIKPKQVRWLWYPYIPFGKVTLLHGRGNAFRIATDNILNATCDFMENLL